ncbi:hypothetical protein HU200_034652 [Digitaria exilis]|uniref:NAD-dependent epimerase/dehydratase domain-containing protein n=1 Tax=Digitaria exilis TaxID=1010633 RepID=A0A835ELX8_9POAL|nr:hypothetical protein HU200_034652 [Digitaria exilis]
MLETAVDSPAGGLVCVIGGSGFIGSWLVRRLLDRGYSVHATKELLEPAVKGTLNVLRAAKDSGIGRVVLMSSKAAMVPNPDWPADKVIDDDSWADIEILKKRQLWYNVSKTLAEKAAWDFCAREEGLQLVVINPGMVLGPFLTPSVNASLHWLLQLVQGQKMDMDLYMGCVDVRDVVDSLIVLYESPSAQGRHLCMESVERLVDFTNHVADLFPELPVQRIKEDKQGWVVRAKDPSKKLIDLGVHFTRLGVTIRDTVDCFKSKGLI